jgi:hypothetical protein
MNDLEQEIWKACRAADDAYEKEGAAGTKEWIREFFLPSLERHGLKITSATAGTNVDLIKEFVDAASDCFRFMRSKAPKNCYQMVPWEKLRAAVLKTNAALKIDDLMAQRDGIRP